jgi:bis(5'-nucleosyl)-tetraphosphatase (symmetrical)
MRYCDIHSRLEFSYKGDPAHCPPGLLPWFEVPHRQDTDWTILFGHWASLQGKSTVSNIHALDTGCAWGNCLTAFCLETGERTAVSCS